MPRRGDDGQLPNVSVEQELQVVDNQLMEGDTPKSGIVSRAKRGATYVLVIGGE